VKPNVDGGGMTADAGGGGGGGGGSGSDASSAGDGATGDGGPTECPGQKGLTRTQLTTMVTAGKCMAAMDLDTICAINVSGLTASCGLSVLDQNKNADGPVDPAKLGADTVACVKSQLGLKNASASDACLGCYGAAALCALKNCLAVCIPDPNTAACLDCRETNGCTGAFFTCSGLPATPGLADAGAPMGDGATPAVDAPATPADAGATD
jgi:hypothetical protein